MTCCVKPQLGVYLHPSQKNGLLPFDNKDGHLLISILRSCSAPWLEDCSLFIPCEASLEGPAVSDDVVESKEERATRN